MNALWIWLGIAAALVVIEVLTLELVFIMFAAGAIGGGIAAVAGAGTPLQIVVAAAITAVGLLVVRPIGIRHLKTSSPDTVTNVDALIGKPVRILTAVTATTGTAQINGETWSARVDATSAELPVGARAVVRRIDGAYLILSDVPPSPREPDS